MSQTRVEGTIRKALSGFYYVQTEQTLVTCRARGKFRYQKVTPLVGDRVAIALQPDGSGSLVEILPRRNAFQRPAVANLDQLVIIASGAVPVSDPFLLDRIISLAERKGCEPILCINKWDLVPAQQLLETYRAAGIPALPVSAVTGLGIDQLRGLLAGKISAFTGNSGVGKSSLLNALDPAFGLATGEISEKLGRGATPPGMWSCSPWQEGSLRTHRAFPPSIRRRERTRWSKRPWPGLSGSFVLTWANAASWAVPM